MSASRTSDLAVENYGFAAPHHPFKVTEEVRGGFTVLHSDCPDGLCSTIISGRIWQESAAVRRKLSSAAAEIISETVNSPRRVLFCGIGNPSVPSDSLGARIAERLIVTGEEHTPSVFAIRTGIQAHTGIDTADYIRCVAEMLRPDIIIAADALAARSRERLQTVIQVSRNITPGSALAHTSGEISARTMPCPVAAIGVPTVISTAAFDDNAEPLLVTRAESDVITDCYASVIANALNLAIFGK